MHISIIKGIRLGSTNLQTHKGQREIKVCLHNQNTKQITIIIIILFNKLAAVAADASLCLQICGPMPDSFYNGKMHYKMDGIYIYIIYGVKAFLLLSNHCDIINNFCVIHIVRVCMCVRRCVCAHIHSKCD